MRTLGVLARSLRTARGGVDGYIEALVRHGAPQLRERGGRMLVYVDEDEVAHRLRDAPCELRVVPMGPLGRFGWDHLASVRRAAADRVDVLVCPRSFRPLWAPCATVTLVYDLMYFDARDTLVASDHAAYFRALHRRSLHESEAIVVFSAFTRARILANLPRVAPERVHVLPPGGPDAAFRPLEAGTVAARLGRLGVGAPYLLAVGLHPRKDVESIVRALAHSSASLRLVVAAASHDSVHRHRLERLASAEGVGGRLLVLPGVAPDDLVALYNGAQALVYASRYEGIGIPPLEAMACGCPVIAAGSASIPEVVGDAALTFAPGDVTALGAAIDAIGDDAGLVERLRVAGRRRLAAFDWEATTRALLDVAERA